jgi:hypothetical protein
MMVSKFKPKIRFDFEPKLTKLLNKKNDNVSNKTEHDIKNIELYASFKFVMIVHRHKKLQTKR